MNAHLINVLLFSHDKALYCILVSRYDQGVYYLWYGGILCVLLILALFNITGVVNTFLSWPGFVPLGKLTYTCYLFHPLVIIYVYYTSSTMLYVQPVTMVSPHRATRYM